MPGPTFLETLLTSVNSPEDIVEKWNELSSQRAQEEENLVDSQDGICDLVLEISDPNAFNNEYSHLEGLASLPKPGRVLERTSAAPQPGSARLAGTAEVSLRTAMRFDRIGLIETEEEEPEWQVDKGQRLFAGWKALRPYKLPESRNLVQEVADQHQARWDNAKIEIDVGVGGGLEGFFGIVYGWFHPTEWTSLYRSKPRDIYAWNRNNVPDADDLEILTNLESQLFDTSKFHGISEFMTVLTYGDGYHGVATLMRVTLQPRTNLALLVDPLATMKDVPKEILRTMQKKVTSMVKLVQRGDKIRCLTTGGQNYPAPACVTTLGTNKKGRTVKTPWEIGGGWRQALGIQHDPQVEHDGIVSTIPQMMALLHLKGSGLHDLKSSSVESFSEALTAVPHENDKDRLAFDWSIGRAVQILEGPQRDGHSGNRVTVVVLFPRDSPWAAEQILWA